MAIRPAPFACGEYYHCYNRGVDKRTIFNDTQDYIYFLKMLRHFNTSEVLGKLRLQETRDAIDPPVTLLSYSLLPNHYHLLIRCNNPEGLSKFMQRLGGGYTMYFNKKNNRSGSLFQGKFKSKHIESDQDLRQVLAYVNNNHVVHGITDTSLYRTSLNTKDDLVRGLASNLPQVWQDEVVDIIKEMRKQHE